MRFEPAGARVSDPVRLMGEGLVRIRHGLTSIGVRLAMLSVGALLWLWALFVAIVRPIGLGVRTIGRAAARYGPLALTVITGFAVIIAVAEPMYAALASFLSGDWLSGARQDAGAFGRVIADALGGLLDGVSAIRRTVEDYGPEIIGRVMAVAIIGFALIAGVILAALIAGFVLRAVAVIVIRTAHVIWLGLRGAGVVLAKAGGALWRAAIWAYRELTQWFGRLRRRVDAGVFRAAEAGEAWRTRLQTRWRAIALKVGTYFVRVINALVLPLARWAQSRSVWLGAGFLALVAAIALAP